MASQELILKALLNILSVISIYILNTSFLGKSKKSKIILFISYMIFYFIITFSYLYIGYPLIISLTVMIGTFILSFLYEATLIRKIFSSIIIFTTLIIIENSVAVFFISDKVYILDEVKYDLIVILALSKLFSVFISIIIYFIFGKKTNIMLPAKYYLILPLIMVFNMIQNGFLVVDYKPSLLLVGIIIIVTAVVNFALFSMYNDILDLFEEKINSISLENQYKLIEAQNENIERSIIELISFEHDLKNKLVPISFIAENQNNEDLSEYAKQILKDFSERRILKSSGIVELDSIINVKKFKCEDLGIKLSYNIDNIGKVDVNGMDLAVIAGNLLDNGIEGTSRVIDKWININIRLAKGILMMSVENSYDGIFNKKGTDFITRKENKMYHGMGIRNIKTILKKYDGEIEFFPKHKTFRAVVLIYPK